MLFGGGCAPSQSAGSVRGWAARRGWFGQCSPGLRCASARAEVLCSWGCWVSGCWLLAEGGRVALSWPQATGPAVRAVQSDSGSRDGGHAPCGRSTAPCGAVQAAVGAPVRARSCLRARTVNPPHTPCCWFVARASARQSSRASHPSHRHVSRPEPSCGLRCSGRTGLNPSRGTPPAHATQRSPCRSQSPHSSSEPS